MARVGRVDVRPRTNNDVETSKNGTDGVTLRLSTRTILILVTVLITLIAVTSLVLATFDTIRYVDWTIPTGKSIQSSNIGKESVLQFAEEFTKLAAGDLSFNANRISSKSGANVIVDRSMEVISEAPLLRLSTNETGVDWRLQHLGSSLHFLYSTDADSSITQMYVDNQGNVFATGSISAESIKINGDAEFDKVITDALVSTGPMIGTSLILSEGITAKDMTLTNSFSSAKSISAPSISTDAIITKTNGSNLVLSTTGGGRVRINQSPVDGLDVVNKSYVDSFAAGLTFLEEVKTVTDNTLPANIANTGYTTLTGLSNGSLGSISGYAVQLNDRILVNTTNKLLSNGIYTVTSLGGFASTWVLTRASDMAGPTTRNGSYVLINSGTRQGAGYVLSTPLESLADEPLISIGLESLVFNKYLVETNFVSNPSVASLAVADTIQLAGLSDGILSLSSNNMVSGVATTDLLGEGTSNKYYTDARVQGAVASFIKNSSSVTWTYSAVGQSLTPTVSLSGLSTDSLAEGSVNKYYSTTRFNNDLKTKTSDDLKEGSTNLYLTSLRGQTIIKDFLKAGGGITWTYSSGSSSLTPSFSLSSYSADDLKDGGVNQYFTLARARGAFSAGDGLNYTSSTGVYALDPTYITAQVSNAVTSVALGSSATIGSLTLSNFAETVPVSLDVFGGTTTFSTLTAEKSFFNQSTLYPVTNVTVDSLSRFGFSFQVGSSDIYVTKLGISRELLGLASIQTRSVGVYLVNGDLLFQVAVSYDGNPVGYGYQYGSLSAPYKLSAGSTYVLMASLLVGDMNKYNNTSRSSASEVTYIAGRKATILSSSVLPSIDDTKDDLSRSYVVVDLSFKRKKTSLTASTSTGSLVGSGPFECSSLLVKNTTLTFQDQNVEAMYRITSSGYQTYPTGFNMYGVRFRVGPRDLYVTHLSLNNYIHDSGARQVGIYTTGGSLVGYSQVDYSDSGNLINEFRTRELASEIHLSAFQFYTLAIVIQTGDRRIQSDSFVTPSTIASGIKILDCSIKTGLSSANLPDTDTTTAVGVSSWMVNMQFYSAKTTVTQDVVTGNIGTIGSVECGSSSTGGTLQVTKKDTEVIAITATSTVPSRLVNTASGYQLWGNELNPIVDAWITSLGVVACFPSGYRDVGLYDMSNHAGPGGGYGALIATCRIYTTSTNVDGFLYESIGEPVKLNANGRYGIVALLVNGDYLTQYLGTGSTSVGTSGAGGYTTTPVTSFPTYFSTNSLRDDSDEFLTPVNFKFQAVTSTYVVNNTTGAVTTGVWQGTAVDVKYGGTGQTSFADGELLVGNSTGNTLSKTTLTPGTGISILNEPGSITISATGVGGGGTVGVTSGGTGQTSYTSGQLLIGTAAGSLAKGTLTQGSGITITNGSGSITIAVGGTITSGTWQGTTIGTEYGGTGQTSYSSGDVLIGTSGGSLAKGSLTQGSGITITNGSGSITIAVASTYAGGTLIATVGTISTGVWQGTAVGPGYGGTGQTSFLNGELLIGNSTGNTLSKSTLTQGSGITITNGSGLITIAVASTYAGGTSISTIGTITTGTWQGSTIGTGYGGTGQTSYSRGELLIGTSGGSLAKGTLMAGSGITITNGSGSITVASSMYMPYLSIGNGSIDTDLSIFGGSIQFSQLSSQIGVPVMNHDFPAGFSYSSGGTDIRIAGYSFTVGATDIYVTALGVNDFCWSSGTRDVALYANNGALITSATVSRSDSQYNQARYHALTDPIQLTAGETYCVVAILTVPSNVITGVSNQTFDSAITFVSSKVVTVVSSSVPLTDGTEDSVVEYFANADILFATKTNVLSIDQTGIISGTSSWQGTAISPGYGGTGQTSFIDGQLLIGNSTGNTLSKATLTQGSGITIANGSGSITVSVSSSYAGGTSITTLGTVGTGVWQATVIGVSYGGTGQSSYTNGQLLIGNSTGNTLTKATLTEGSGITITNGTGSITIAVSSSYAGGTSITALGTIGTGVWQGTAVGVSYGGTGQTSYTNGQLLIGNSTGNTLTKATLTEGSGITVTNGTGSITIAVSSSYTGGTSITTLGTIGTGVWQGTTIGTGYGGTGQTTYSSGELLIGNSSGSLTKANLSGGTGVSVTNGSGSITMAIGQSVATSSVVTFAGMELVSIGGNPYIDFATEATDYNARLRLVTNDVLSVDIGVGNPCRFSSTGTYLYSETRIPVGHSLRFGGDMAGAEGNSGRIAAQWDTPGALDIIGVGTTTANRSIKIWAEGGTTFTGSIQISGTSASMIGFDAVGVAAPTLGSSSAGTKIRLWPDAGVSTVDYAIGIDAFTLWQTVPTSSCNFSWYGGTTVCMRLAGTGIVTMPYYTGASYLKTDSSGVISCSSATFTTDVQAQLSAGTGVTYSSGAISIGQSVATSATPVFSNLKTGLTGLGSNYTGIMYNGLTDTTDYLVLQSWEGDSFVNCKSGQTLALRAGNSNICTFTSSQITSVVNIVSSGKMIATSELVCRASSSTEGGQVTLGYGGNYTLDGENAGSWLIDVFNADLRIFRKDALSAYQIAIQIAESGQIQYPYYTGASYLKTDGSGVVSCSSATFTTDVRAQLSAGTGVTYSSGAISIGQDVATSASPVFSNLKVGNVHSSGFAGIGYNGLSTTEYCVLQENDGTSYLNCASGKNIHFRTNNVDMAVLNSSSFTLSMYTGASYLKTDSSGVISCSSSTFTTDVRSQLSAGTGVSYSGGAFSIGQSVSTSSAVTFGSITASSNPGMTVLTLSSGNGADVSQGAQIQMTNTSTGATNANKYMRVSSTGSFQVLNSAYSGSILSITDAGVATMYQMVVNGGEISMSNGSANWITYNAAGVDVPTYVNSSAGTKLRLFPSVDASNVDYAIGIGPSHLWTSVQNSGASFVWYGGTFACATLAGSGLLTLPYYNGSSYLKTDGSGVLSCSSSTFTTDVRSQISGSSPITFSSGAIGLNYNATNLKITSSAINTIQDIATTSGPQFDLLGIGAAAQSNIALNIAKSITATSGGSNLYGLAVGGTLSYTTAAINSYATGMTASCPLVVDGSSSISDCATATFFAPTKSGAGTVTNARSLYTQAPTIGSSVNQAHLTDNLVVGNGLGTSNPPANGMMCQGLAQIQGGIDIGTTSSNVIHISNGDSGTGMWIRNDGLHTVISTNVGDMYIGYSGNTSKVIRLGNAVGGFQVYGNAPNASLVLDSSGITQIPLAGALRFGGDMVGAESNSGLIGASKFTTDTLDVIGIGTSGSNRKIKFWAEGGATFTGSPILSANTANTLCYHDGSKAIKSATLGAGLSLSSGELTVDAVSGDFSADYTLVSPASSTITELKTLMTRFGNVVTVTGAFSFIPGSNVSSAQYHMALPTSGSLSVNPIITGSYITAQDLLYRDAVGYVTTIAFGTDFRAYLTFGSLTFTFESTYSAGYKFQFGFTYSL